MKYKNKYLELRGGAGNDDNNNNLPVVACDNTEKETIIDSIITNDIEEILKEFLESPVNEEKANKENIYRIVKDINDRMQVKDKSTNTLCNIEILKTKLNPYIMNKLQSIADAIKKNNQDIQNNKSNITQRQNIIENEENKNNAYIKHNRGFIETNETDKRKNERDKRKNENIKNKFIQFQTELNDDNLIRNISTLMK
jgi:hypothetical protein